MVVVGDFRWFIRHRCCGWNRHSCVVDRGSDWWCHRLVFLRLQKSKLRLRPLAYRGMSLFSPGDLNILISCVLCLILYFIASILFKTFLFLFFYFFFFFISSYHCKYAGILCLNLFRKCKKQKTLCW